MKNVQFLITIGSILLSTKVCEASVNTTVAWNPSLKDISGKVLTAPVSYKLFYSETSGVYSQYVDAGSSNVADVAGLTYSKTYFFRAKAYTSSGESAYSDELTWVAPDIPVATVDVTLAWDPSLKDVNGKPLTDSVGYKLFYSTTSGVYSTYVDVGASNTADVTGLEYNKTYFFKAKAYTSSGESAYSAEVAWTSPAMPADSSISSLNMMAVASAGNPADSDQDGIEDQNEFIAGTDSADPTDYPKITIRAGTSGATVSFEAKQASGAGYENKTRYYTLMRCDDLAEGIWKSVPSHENIPAADQTVRYDTASESPKAFYRTEIRLE